MEEPLLLGAAKDMQAAAAGTDTDRPTPQPHAEAPTPRAEALPSPAPVSTSTSTSTTTPGPAQTEAIPTPSHATYALLMLVASEDINAVAESSSTNAPKATAIDDYLENSVEINEENESLASCDCAGLCVGGGARAGEGATETEPSAEPVQCKNCQIKAEKEKRQKEIIQPPPVKNGGPLKPCAVAAQLLQGVAVGVGIHHKTLQKSGRDFENEDHCLFCWDGGDLVCCDRCPASFHPDCVGLKKLSSESKVWICPQHNCEKCNTRISSRKESTEFMFRCSECPRAFCEEHLPPDAVMSGRNLRMERMGFKHPKLTCYMQCRESCQQWAAKVAEWPTDWNLTTFERVEKPREEAGSSSSGETALAADGSVVMVMQNKKTSAKTPKTKKKKAKHADKNDGYADDGFVVDDDDEKHAKKKRKAEKQAKASLGYDAGGDNVYVDTEGAVNAMEDAAQYAPEPYQHATSPSSSYSLDNAEAAVNGYYSVEPVMQAGDTGLVMSLRDPLKTAHLVPVVRESKAADFLAVPSDSTYLQNLQNVDSSDDDGGQ